MPLVCYAVLSVLSSFVTILLRKRERKPRDYKPFSMLNSAEHEINPAHKC